VDAAGALRTRAPAMLIGEVCRPEHGCFAVWMQKHSLGTWGMIVTWLSDKLVCFLLIAGGVQVESTSIGMLCIQNWEVLKMVFFWLAAVTKWGL